MALNGSRRKLFDVLWGIKKLLQRPGFLFTWRECHSESTTFWVQFHKKNSFKMPLTFVTIQITKNTTLGQFFSTACCVVLSRQATVGLSQLFPLKTDVWCSRKQRYESSDSKQLNNELKLAIKLCKGAAHSGDHFNDYGINGFFSLTFE